MNQIIDPVEKLLERNDDEIRELLLNEKYNKANLRELIRRIIDNNHNLLKELKLANKQLDNMKAILDSEESNNWKIDHIEDEFGYGYLK